MAQQSTTVKLVVGTFKGSPTVTFRRDESDRYPFTFMGEKAKLLANAIATHGEAVVVGHIRTFAKGDKPNMCKSKCMCMGEYKGSALIRFNTTGNDSDFGFAFGAAKAIKLVDAIDTHGLDAVVDAIFQVAGMPRTKPVPVPAPAPKAKPRKATPAKVAAPAKMAAKGQRTQPRA